ncbi:MAG: hypothetical protein ETSY2_27320 [Candidatus Entotheonella gemina]|uniref:Uncharacterized protein n=1 Tax=Candidatus Entotheonella gemina TaxID=1429439 RepID=W4M4Y2_9BACT|nr:MAG: hypothetical protein ETSY2_27320 [Candidatus Entotheonella gemina]
MFQCKHGLFHRNMPFEDEPTRIKQGKARDQAQGKMTVVGVFGVRGSGSWAGLLPPSYPILDDVWWLWLVSWRIVS